MVSGSCGKRSRPGSSRSRPKRPIRASELGCRHSGERLVVDRQVDQRFGETKRDGEELDRIIALGRVEDVAADQDPGKGAQLMAEEHDAEQYCHVTHVEDVHDDAVDERERAEPSEADARGKDDDRDWL